ncbi:MAG: ribonuclease H family protein [Bacteroidales bacterium]|nr:ribonuclease H family protein [Bacteroidales bacterium]MDY4584866.1 ribonuclease H family protein [Candidatus Onthomorpha sp.]MDY4932863.1 ribonuclease H family protein [Candidatus Onthomorpha sp.]
MAKQKKYYVVWNGRKCGVFDRWEECKQSVSGFGKAKYKAFDTLSEAEQAYASNPDRYIFSKPKTPEVKQSSLTAGLPILDAIATDAACSGNPGVMEYRGVYIKTGKTLFHYKHSKGTNNIGEFLGIVHGLSYLKRRGLTQPLYTDSVNAIKWVREKKCRTTMKQDENNKDLFEYIARAEKWLQENDYTTQILKWETDVWGEIPADFGRK